MSVMDDRRWHIAARWYWAAFLGVVTLAAWGKGYLETPVPPLATCVAVALYNALLPPLARRFGVSRDRLVLACLALDIASLTVYLHFTGDIENPLKGAYVLPVVAAVLLLSRRQGFLLAAGSLALFSLLMTMTAFEASPLHLAHYHLALLGGEETHTQWDPDLNPHAADYIVAHMLWQAVLLFGSAFGFGELVARIREKDLALDRELERLQLLMDTLPVGVALIDADGRFEVCNRAASELMGGATPSTLLSAAPEFGLSARVETLGPGVAEFETTRGDRILGHALARRSEHGPIVWVFRDMTVQRRLMAQTIHHSKMADIGLLAAGIAHEIGNPLSSMSALLQILARRNVAPEVAEKLTALGSHVERIHRIVRTITGFARPSPEARVRVHAAAAVEKALAIFRLHPKSKGVSVEARAVDGALGFVGVEDQIVQVLLNLLLNAADASPAAGRVTVEAFGADGEVVFGVEDQGTGVTAQVRERLFAPFFTTKPEGSGVGLGLFISDSIVRAHGGRIEVCAGASGGARFEVRLPAARREESP